ncbi:MAG: hypothetical protein J7521_01205 [Caulobacter sp.]|nr:hypothetical protein [Caulobacter sp.]
MSDIAPLAPRGRRFDLALSCALAGFLAWADGRLWPPLPDRAGDDLGLLVLLQLLIAAWAERSWLGRLPLVLVNGLVFWRAIVWASAAMGDRESRLIVLACIAFLAAWIIGALVWRRLPVAWRERYAASKAQRVVGWGAACSLLGALVLLMLITVLRDLGPAARCGVMGALLGTGVGLGLAMRWLNGWPRALACWAILSLAWVALMTGIAVAVSPGAVTAGDWLLAFAPPLIVGAVIAAYYRIERAHGL